MYTGSPNSERARPPRNVMPGRNLSISSGKRTREWALTSFPRILLPLVLPRATREWLFSISLKWRACSQAVAVFIVVQGGCIVIMSQSIPRVRIPPKAFVKCWHLLWLSTSEQEWTKLLKFSSVAKPSIPITFTRFITNKRKKSLRF